MFSKLKFNKERNSYILQLFFNPNKGNKKYDFKRCVYWAVVLKSFPWTLTIYDIDANDFTISFILSNSNKPFEENEQSKSDLSFQKHCIHKELYKHHIYWHPAIKVTKDHFYSHKGKVYLVDFSACVGHKRTLPDYARISPALRINKFLPHLRNTRSVSNNTNNCQTTIAIFLHIGSTKTLIHLVDYIKTIMSQPMHKTILICSFLKSIVDENQCKRVIKNIQLEIGTKHTEFWIPVKNSGMDIGGFIRSIFFCMEKEIKFDYVIKIHTKSDKVWRDELCKPILRNGETVNYIINCFNQIHRIGCVASKQWTIPVKTDTHNKNMVAQYCNMFKMKNPYLYDECQNFVGGTIFWIRANIILTFFSLHFDLIHKLAQTLENGYVINSKETHTHTWERLLGIIVSHSGYKFETM